MNTEISQEAIDNSSICDYRKLKLRKLIKELLNEYSLREILDMAMDINLEDSENNKNSNESGKAYKLW